MMASMRSMDSTPGMTPTPAAAATEQAPVINVDFTINYSNFNSAPAITAPTNVTMLPWQTLLGMESNATAEATMEMTSTGTPTETQIPPKTGPTQEMTSEPTSEMSAEPTIEMTTEPTAVGTVEPTVEVTAGS